MKTAFIFSCVVALIMAQKQTYVQEEMVTKHNTDRRRHQVGDLVTNETLRINAQICCNKNAKRNKIVHDCAEQKRLGVGENLAWSMDSRGSPSEQTATKMAYKGWYDEEEPNYNYDTGAPKSKNLVIGHFTQAVWKGTKQIGCAYARNQAEKSAVVCCLYNPPGNYVGENKDNVLRPTTTRPA